MYNMRKIVFLNFKSCKFTLTETQNKIMNLNEHNMGTLGSLYPGLSPNNVQDHQSSSIFSVAFRQREDCCCLIVKKNECDMINEIKMKAFIKTDNYIILQILQTRLKRVAHHTGKCLLKE